jgi:hypothetical protein|tara:strand:+ start:680 stop:811 length:132 start_codon:yes stop_codon:yes gene_type:complete
VDQVDQVVVEQDKELVVEHQEQLILVEVVVDQDVLEVVVVVQV